MGLWISKFFVNSSKRLGPRSKDVRLPEHTLALRTRIINDVSTSCQTTTEQLELKSVCRAFPPSRSAEVNTDAEYETAYIGAERLFKRKIQTVDSPVMTAKSPHTSRLEVQNLAKPENGLPMSTELIWGKGKTRGRRRSESVCLTCDEVAARNFKIGRMNEK